MKKSLLAFSALFSVGSAFSQVVLSENFDAGTTLPAGWAQYNVDGLTPASSVSYMGTSAWVVRANSATGSGNHLVSTSWYTPAGVSNDWVVSPSIAVPNSTGFMCQFDVMAPDAQFLDGYKVYVSTTGNTVADFTDPAVLTVAAAPNTYTTQSFSLDAYMGSNIYIAIQNNSNDKFLLFVDNFVVRKPANDDAMLLSSTLNRYSLTNTNNTLSMQVKNDGANAITSLTIDWNDGTAHSSVISTNIAPGATATVNHPTAVNYATVVEEDLNITITAVNGNSDATDNTSSNKINTVSANSPKVVLIEEGTGTWCGWCPRGAVAMEYMADTYPNTFAGVAVHNGDPMTVTAYDDAAGISAFPGANVDRALLGVDVSTQDFENFYDERIDLISPAGLGIQTGGSGNAVTVTVNATFRTVFAASNYRLGVIITEDNVTGTGSGYNQVNYYSGGANPLNGAGHNWQTAPDPVPAADMEYDHVGRALLGGYMGQAGSVPAVITDGQVASYTFNYTVPGTSNRANMHAVAVLVDQNTGEVVNAKEISLATLGLAEASTINMEVFPNPASDFVNVKFEGQGGEYTVSIIDLAGRTVASKVVTGAGATAVEVPVAGLVAGNYMISVANETGSYTQKLMVK
ncbi:choice-of-anchor J domain-containing protein [uncultured Fluviicola sp.]|uniref:T9SS-dependent choice-of-anchor J family protein n=1 Tax=uncultured Fluviicola sp. TaxID=463303 RepID=UPI0025D7C3A1|nr:choice-of-anchor J domain-containing protein [uncultured Fluviicola sp.]